MFYNNNNKKRMLLKITTHIYIWKSDIIAPYPFLALLKIYLHKYRPFDISIR
jgi:hypothetical protein